MVLVVDDDQDVREVICEVLERAGIRVASAEDGARALESVRSELPDLILLDLRMPIMSGAQFLPRLRALDHGGEVPVVVMSAFADLKESAGLDSQACLKKPFSLAELFEVVERWGTKGDQKR